MSIDRESFKSTAYIDKLIKEVYSVVLFNTDIFKVRDVIRGRKVGDGAWNKRSFGYQVQKRPGPYGNWPESANDSSWNDDLVSANSDIPIDYPRWEFYPDGSLTPSGEIAPLWSPETWYRVKIMVCITHPAALEHNSRVQTITRNPNMPVALPGDWGPARYHMDGKFLRGDAAEDDSLADCLYRVDQISGARVIQPGEKFATYDHIANGHRANTRSLTWGFWNMRKDITEDCAEVVYFKRNSPEGLEYRHDQNPPI